MQTDKHRMLDSEINLLVYECIQAMKIYVEHIDQQKSLIQIRNQEDFNRVIQMVVDGNTAYMEAP